MKKHNIAFLIIIVLAVWGLAGCGSNNPMGSSGIVAPMPTPTITAISPASGGAGTVVTITGTNFSPVATNNVIKFNGTQAVVASATATVIVVTVPANASTGSVTTVTTSGGTVTSTLFTVLRTFMVSAVDPFGNVAKGYLGAIHFLSSDIAALLPPNYTFTAGNLGIANFSIFFGTAGIQTLTVTDTVNALITGSTSVVVP